MVLPRVATDAPTTSAKHDAQTTFASHPRPSISSPIRTTSTDAPDDDGVASGLRRTPRVPACASARIIGRIVMCLNLVLFIIHLQFEMSRHENASMQRNAHPATTSGKNAETKASPPMLAMPTESMTPPQSMQPAFCPFVFVSPCPPTGSVTRSGLSTCVDRSVFIDAPPNADCSPAVTGLPTAYASAPTIDSFVANPINLFICFLLVSEALLVKDGRVACRAASRQRQRRSGDPDGCHPRARGNQCGAGGDASQAGRDCLPAPAIDIGHLGCWRGCGPRRPNLLNPLRPQQ